MIIQQQKAEKQTQATLAANVQQGKATADEAATAYEVTTNKAAVDEVAQMAAAMNGSYEAATEVNGFA